MVINGSVLNFMQWKCTTMCTIGCKNFCFCMCVASFGSLNISRSGMHVEIYVFQTASKQNTFFHYTFLTFFAVRCWTWSNRTLNQNQKWKISHCDTGVDPLLYRTEYVHYTFPMCRRSNQRTQGSNFLINIKAEYEIKRNIHQSCYVVCTTTREQGIGIRWKKRARRRNDKLRECKVGE